MDPQKRKNEDFFQSSLVGCRPLLESFLGISVKLFFPLYICLNFLIQPLCLDPDSAQVWIRIQQNRDLAPITKQVIAHPEAKWKVLDWGDKVNYYTYMHI